MLVCVYMVKIFNFYEVKNIMNPAVKVVGGLALLGGAVVLGAEFSRYQNWPKCQAEAKAIRDNNPNLELTTHWHSTVYGGDRFALVGFTADPEIARTLPKSCTEVELIPQTETQELSLEVDIDGLRLDSSFGG